MTWVHKLAAFLECDKSSLAVAIYLSWLSLVSGGKVFSWCWWGPKRSCGYRGGIAWWAAGRFRFLAVRGLLLELWLGGCLWWSSVPLGGCL